MHLRFPIGIHIPRSIINDCLQCTVYDDMEHVITTALYLPPPLAVSLRTVELVRWAHLGQ